MEENYIIDNNQKTIELLSLVNSLCNPNALSNDEKILNTIDKLNNIYDNEYRHNYSEIFLKIQDIICSKKDDDLEVLDALGANLNLLKEQIKNKINCNTENITLKNTYYHYNKLVDHILLETSRYSFLKEQFKKVECKTSFDSSDNYVKQQEFEEKLQKIDNDINNTKSVTTNAQKAIDGLDSKLETNKISSITTLTIFSAVILAFSGGIAFESGVFKGMSHVSPYRLVFIIALTGFILFNTIFALLYLVSKMINKSIASKCNYCVYESSNSHKPKCGSGYCTKKIIHNTVWCQLGHKYCYVLIINIILLEIMYSDFILWEWESNNLLGYSYFICFQIAPIIIFFLAVVINFITRKFKIHQAIIQCNISILDNLLHEHKDNFFTLLAKTFMDEANNNDDLKNRIKDMNYNDAKKYIKSLALRKFHNEQSSFSFIDFDQHLANKKMLKSLEKEFQQKFYKK